MNRPDDWRALLGTFGKTKVPAIFSAARALEKKNKNGFPPEFTLSLPNGRE